MSVHNGHMPGDEQVLAVIPHADLSAGLGTPSRTHTLVFTDQRIIFARFTSGMARRYPPSEIIDKYEAMSPDDILAEHKSNFAVDRSTITKVRMKYTGGLGTGAVAEVLTIKTDERTYKLSLSSSKQPRKALNKAGLSQSTS
jgi:hypothetical protein